MKTYLRPALTFALLAGTSLLLMTGCSKQAKRDRHLSRAEKYFAAAEYEQAALEYQNVLRLEPTNQAVVLRMARIFFEQGSPLRGLQVLQSPGLKAEDPILRCRLAEFHLASGDRATARAEALALATQFPTNTDALLLFAATASTAEEIKDTDARLQQFAQQYPTLASPLLARAALLLRQKQMPTAESLIQHSLQLDPNSAQAHLQMAQIHLLRTNIPAADQSFTNAARLAPYRSNIRVAYAQSKAAVGQRAEARGILNELLKQAPDYNPAALLLARFEAADQKYPAALAQTDRVISRDPLNLDARQLRSQIHASMNQPEKAVQEWVDFDQRLAPNPVIKLQVARAQLANGDPQRAITALDQSIRLSSNRLDSAAIQAHLLRARLDLQGGNPGLAVESLRRFLSRTNVVEGRLLLVDAYRQQGRADDALATLRDLIRAAPDNPTFYYLLGGLLQQARRLPEARAAFQRSLELAPGNLLSFSQLVETELAVTNAPAALRLIQAEAARYTNSAPLSFLEGRVYAAQRQWPQAEAALKRALALDPSLFGAYQMLASIYTANTNAAGATRELEALLARQTNNVATMMTLGILYEQQSNWERARQMYERLLATAPGMAAAMNNLAYLYAERLKQPDQALELARKARQTAPDDGAIADTLGWILYQRGEHEQALPLLREAATKLPGSAEILYHLGMTSSMLGQTEAAKIALQQAVASPAIYPGKDEARLRLASLSGTPATGGAAAGDLAALEKMVKDQPKDLSSRARLAANYEAKDQTRAAATEYEEILRQNPRSAPAAQRLAFLYAGPLNNHAKALEFARKARALDPNDSEAAVILGRLVYQDGDHAQAYSLLLPAAQKLPQRAEVQYAAAWAAYSLGRVAEADQTMRRALAADPKFKQADAARWFIAMTTPVLDPKALAQAETQIQQLLKADPANAPALMAQAALLRSKGDAKATVPLYQKVLTAFPKFAPAIRELALLSAADPAQPQQAYDLLVRARENYPEDLEVTRALAVLSYQRKDYRYAVPLLQAGLRTKPNDADALYYLGVSLVQTKDVIKGKEQLQKAIAAGLKEPLLAEAKRLLAAAPGK